VPKVKLLLLSIHNQLYLSLFTKNTQNVILTVVIFHGMLICHNLVR